MVQVMLVSRPTMLRPGLPGQIYPSFLPTNGAAASPINQLSTWRTMRSNDQSHDIVLRVERVSFVEEVAQCAESVPISTRRRLVESE